MMEKDIAFFGGQRIPKIEDGCEWIVRGHAVVHGEERIPSVIFHPEFGEGRYHENGGGFVASTAYAAPTAYVGKGAAVADTSRVEGYAKILDNATISGDSLIKDHAMVSGKSVVDDSIVDGCAIVEGDSCVTERSHVTDRAVISNSTIFRGSLVHDQAEIVYSGVSDATIKGEAYIAHSFVGGGIVQGYAVIISGKVTNDSENVINARIDIERND